jgi:hypothetical protein
LRWVPPRGALGAAIGAIAIGTAATSTSTTTIISIGTTTRTLIEAKLARATSGSIIRNIAEMRRMVTEEPRTSSVAMRVSSRAAELAVVVAPGAPVELAVRVAREALAELAVQVDREAPVELAVQVAQEALVELAVQVVELELNRVEAQELVRVEPAVPPKTKSVTAAHRRGLVLVPKRVEDLAAAAETTREPAATEAAAVWVAAVLQ